MTKRFVIPFAATGDKTTTPDATDPAGAISYSQGWPVAYQLANTDPAYRPVGRQEMNGVLNDITAALGELQLQGLPAWVAPGGLVPPYPVNALVRHNDVNWRNTVANNSAEPGVGAGWVDTSVIQATTSIVGLTRYGTAPEQLAGTLNTVASTPAGVQSQISDIPHGAQFFTSAGTTTFTVPPKVFRIFYEIVGGGGGGGASTVANSGAGGAGSGAYSRGSLAVTPGQVLSLTVGAGGAQGAGGNGSPGGTSTFGGFVSCPGGFGSGVIAVVGIGQQGFGANIATGGQFNSFGSPGFSGVFGSASYFGGNGGSSPYGGPLPGSSGYPGGAFGAPGAGGSGGANGNFGGNGSPGAVSITW